MPGEGCLLRTPSSFMWEQKRLNVSYEMKYKKRRLLLIYMTVYRKSLHPSSSLWHPFERILSRVKVQPACFCVLKRMMKRMMMMMVTSMMSQRCPSAALSLAVRQCVCIPVDARCIQCMWMYKCFDFCLSIRSSVRIQKTTQTGCSAELDGYETLQ